MGLESFVGKKFSNVQVELNNEARGGALIVDRGEGRASAVPPGALVVSVDETDTITKVSRDSFL